MTTARTTKRQRPRKRPGSLARPRKVLLAWLTAALAATALPGAATTAAAADRDPGPAVEQRVLKDLQDKGRSTFWVYLKDRADLTGTDRIKDRARQGRVVEDRLKETARNSQAGLMGVLHRADASYTSYWIANTVKVTGDEALLERITALPGVAEITADRTYALPEIQETETEAVPAADGVEWGLDRIGAPKVWSEFGATGQGVVVGSIDSGVQFNHPALVAQYRGNKGDGTFTHDYNWFDGTVSCGVIPSLSTPCDNVGHGTHTVGTMVGDGGAGNHVGVAPGAKWIAAKGCATGTCTQSSLLSSGQFMLAPTDRNGKNPRPELRPHVINNSWGSAAVGADPWFRQTVQSWVAAGIFPVFSNGNEGPECGTDANPANLPESYGVGAFDADGAIASFSSRGPSENSDDIIKPNVSAPGVAIRSTYPGSRYAVGSGTSMAAPHVAGAIALLWSAAPSISRDLDATRRLLDETAVDVEDLTCGGTDGNNNVWGQGRMDAYAAVAKAPRGATGTLTGTVTDAVTGEPVAGATVQPGDASGPVGLPEKTDADGHYTVLASTGDYTVTVSALAYTTGTATASVTEGAATTSDLALAVPEGRHLDVTPGSGNFGTVPIGTTGGPVSVTLTGTGSDPVMVKRITDHDGAFVSEAGSCGPAPFKLAHKEQCTLDITFRPSAKGEQQGTITLEGTAAEGPQAVAVRGSGTPMPARTAKRAMLSSEKYMHAAVVDPAGRYGYFGTDNAPDPLVGTVVKIDLKTMQRVGRLGVGIGQKLLQDAVIDPAGKYAYFVAASTPSRIVRIDLETFTLDKILLLGTGEDNARSIVMDPAGAYVYVGTGTSPGRVVKVDLATFTRIGAVTLAAGEDFLDTGVIDPKGEFAYFGTVTYPQGRVAKVDLASMTEVDSIALATGEVNLRTSVMAPDGRYAYFGTGEGSSAKVVRVDLTAFGRDAALSPPGAAPFFSSTIDPSGRFAVFGTLTLPGRVVKVDLEKFQGAGYLTLDENEDALISAVIDRNGDYAFFGTKTAPGRIIKVRVGSRYEMTAAGSHADGVFATALTWNGATTAEVEVVRNGEVVATVPNTGRYRDVIGVRERPAYRYKLCDAGTDHCSNEVSVDFTGTD
ncbi:S8 family serine peptidase [Streptomyces sp. NPDC051940]|uniref:S8 family serine peptidase n=1 Tax=Streptomyces sp. NPDC051940 TaxID=3155675 RepID=UPI00341317B3